MTIDTLMTNIGEVCRVLLLMLNGPRLFMLLLYVLKSLSIIVQLPELMAKAVIHIRKAPP